MGLHPLDVHVLLKVFSQLIDQGATVLMITHDLDLMANADYLIDMGPRGGDQGGQIVAKGRPQDLIVNPQSLTTRYLAEHFEKFRQK